jgi:4-hydroxyphenylpyruvate dioxygenase-like putative hemolysin
MAKKSKANAAGAKKAKVTPTYMKGKKPLKIGLHDVIKALKVIEDHGHMSKFRTAAKKNKAVMLVNPQTVNFVKDFMVKHDMHKHPVGKHIVNARTAATRGAKTASAVAATAAKDPFECDFSKH